MSGNSHVKAALYSFGRTLAATAISAYLELGKAPLDLELSDLKTLVNATIAAGILFAFNFVRPGETRFGLNAEDRGMGGEDNLEKPGGEDLSEVVQKPKGGGRKGG